MRSMRSTRLCVWGAIILWQILGEIRLKFDFEKPDPFVFAFVFVVALLDGQITAVQAVAKLMGREARRES